MVSRAAAIGICGLWWAAMAADKPPVILISIDTLRADHLSAYGYAKLRTPNIDAFAEHGTLYRQIDAQIPLTLPSHAVLMTSAYPFAAGVDANDQTVRAGAATLASVLRTNGYRTAAFIGSFILDKHCGLDQGFDFYDSPFRQAASANPYGARVRRDGALVVRAALQWLAENRERPAFAFLHFYDLHTPYPLAGMAGMRPNAAGYDAQLRHVDQLLGAFRERLVRDGWWDRSLVLLLSDHGEGLGDHGESSHGYFIYESTLHVPLIVHWPAGALPQPASSDEAAGLIDVAPTILDALGIPAPPSFAGASLRRKTGARAVFSESVYPRDTFGWAALRSIRERAYKYIAAPRAEFYDLSKDPGEHTNVLAAHMRQAEALQAQLAGLLARAPQHPRQSRPAASGTTGELLRSLGYTAAVEHRAGSGDDPKDRLGEEEGYENGLALLYTGNYAAAIAALHAVTARDSRNLPALCALGEAYFRSGDAPRALAAWQQALDRDPAYRPAAESLGSYWLARHDSAKGCRYLPQAPECAAK